MTRRLGFEQWMAITVALLVVLVILGAGSASLARAELSANDIQPGDAPAATPSGATLGAAAAHATGAASDDPADVIVTIEPGTEAASGEAGAKSTTAPASRATTTTGTGPAATTPPASGSTTTTTTTTTTNAATTTTTTTSTTTTTTAPPPPPAPSIQYYAGNTSDFCARLSGVRTGAGLPALASCTQTSALQSVALQFAQAKSVWHVGTNEIVGFTYKEMSGLVANFAASGTHYAVITGGSSGVSANVGCYYREDPADLGARYIFCIAQFAY